ncbi:Trehalose-6-P synthase/phosphatase complex synthase subunit [Friedmanniomyces endolithicus]|nr:Trehalose-6-P synthase/phosphatase complex synthase subunit [Friedmanniomyces endolithicus]
MSDEQRALNYQKMARYVNKYTSAWWGESFVAELSKISDQAEKKLKVRRESTVNPAAKKAALTEARSDSATNKDQIPVNASGQQQKSATLEHLDSDAVDDYSTDDEGIVIDLSFRSKGSSAVATPIAMD